MRKLLVIDDEPGIRFSIKNVFEGEDIVVLDAKDAEEGLRLAADELPDAILLDIQLGRRSGLALFMDLHRIDPGRPVVFITGRGTPEIREQARELGAFDYLVKPLDIVQLRQVVKRAIARSRAPATPDEESPVHGHEETGECEARK